MFFPWSTLFTIDFIRVLSFFYISSFLAFKSGPKILWKLFETSLWSCWPEAISHTVCIPHHPVKYRRARRATYTSRSLVATHSFILLVKTTSTIRLDTLRRKYDKIIKVLSLHEYTVFCFQIQPNFTQAIFSPSWCECRPWFPSYQWGGASLRWGACSPQSPWGRPSWTAGSWCPASPTQHHHED